MEANWKEKLLQKYRKELGCQNLNSRVCWCNVCTGIEKLIREVINKVATGVAEL